MKEFPFNAQKMKELILYISSQNEDSFEFGSTALNKMLYYADLWAFIYFGEPITGDTYIRRSFGPTPKSLVPIREQLEQENAFRIEERDFFGHNQKRPISLKNPDTSMFSKRELAIIDWIISHLKGRSGKEISEMTHGELVWQTWRDGEKIPYEAFFIRKVNPVSQEEMDWALKIAENSKFALTA